MIYREREVQDYRPRYRWLITVIILVFIILVARLWQLQLWSGERYRRLSEQNFVQEVVLPHSRGMILDRHGQILVDNRPSYNVYVTPAFFAPRAAQTMELLRGFLGLSPEEIAEIERSLKQARGLRRFRPLRVRRDISRDQLALMEGHKLELDGVQVLWEPHRHYLHGRFAAHLLGYLNEISEAELAQLRPRGYRLGDYIGRSGTERSFEEYLRGEDGSKKVVVDAKGRRVSADQAEELLRDEPERLVSPRPGHNLILSLDLQLQLGAEEAFSGRAGAVVALDPRTGFILALASFPPFDPNLASGRMSAEEKKRLDGDPLQPWINKAIQQHYPPGSTYKVIPAIAALEEGTIDPEKPFFCPGYYRMGRRAWRCWRTAGHGWMDLHHAIQHSCDVFFYRLGDKLGMDLMARYAKAFGMGEETGLRLDREIPGLVPTVAFHRTHSEEGFVPGLNLNTAIGQGANLLTPLQLALLYAVIANGGVLYSPQVVRRIEDAEGRTLEEHRPVERRRVQLQADTLSRIREGLKAVVGEPGGTAYYRRSRKVEVVGKTGTSQVVRLHRGASKEVDYWHRDHAWFIGYAPADRPEVLVVVLNEHAGHGSSGAAPIAMRVIERWVEIDEERQSASLRSASQP